MSYKRPPIVEAAIEFQIKPQIEVAALDRARTRLKADFRVAEEIKNYNIEINAELGKVNVKNEFLGYRMVDTNSIHICQLRTNGFGVSRLSPYPGWDDFIGAVRDIWREWELATHSVNRISRVGLRFINRFDVPITDLGGFDPNDYFSVGIAVPQPPFPKLDAQAMVIQGAMEGDSTFRFVVQSSTVPSPVLRHGSMLLDIDVAQSEVLPKSEDQLWALVDTMRSHKNTIFENSIRDTARRLIDG